MPETSHHAGAAYKNEWNDSLAGDFLWSSVNFGEAVTDVMTPLTGSVIRFTLDDWVFLPGQPTVGILGGRPYLNISVFATLFYGLGRSRQDLLDYMESTLYMRLPDSLPIPSIPVSRATLLQGIFCALQVEWKQRRGIHATPAYVAANPAWFQGIRQRLAARATPSGLLELWERDLKPHVKNGVWCVLGSAGHSARYTLSLRRELAELVGPQDASILIANLSERDAPLESLGPVIGLDKLARGEISRAAYLESYGHRGPHEFELSAPRPAEDPSWIDQELDRIRCSTVGVNELVARQRQALETAWKRLRARARRSERRFRAQLEESASRARLREMARSAYVRDRWAIRLFALRAGDLTGVGEQVFYLTLPELLALLSGHRSVLDVLAPRAAAYQCFRALPPYPPVIRGPFDPVGWAADPARATDIHDAHGPAAQPADSRVVQGSPGSAGVVEGIVRVIEHPNLGHLLQPGEIMVAAQTDIAWTLLFPRARAVITDVGAPLSHAAIVARELGIPSVVGCGNATMRLKTGDRVRVDGGRGTVEILEPRTLTEVQHDD